MLALPFALLLIKQVVNLLAGFASLISIQLHAVLDSVIAANQLAMAFIVRMTHNAQLPFHIALKVAIVLSR